MGRKHKKDIEMNMSKSNKEKKSLYSASMFKKFLENFINKYIVQQEPHPACCVNCEKDNCLTCIDIKENIKCVEQD